MISTSVQTKFPEIIFISFHHHFSQLIILFLRVSLIIDAIEHTRSHHFLFDIVVYLRVYQSESL